MFRVDWFVCLCVFVDVTRLRFFMQQVGPFLILTTQPHPNQPPAKTRQIHSALCFISPTSKYLVYRHYTAPTIRVRDTSTDTTPDLPKGCNQSIPLKYSALPRTVGTLMLQHCHVFQLLPGSCYQTKKKGKKTRWGDANPRSLVVLFPGGRG